VLCCVTDAYRYGDKWKLVLFNDTHQPTFVYPEQPHDRMGACPPSSPLLAVSSILDLVAPLSQLQILTPVLSGQLCGSWGKCNFAAIFPRNETSAVLL
jgi:hypothetical protein